MRRIGRTTLFVFVLMLTVVPVLLMRGATVAQDAYLFVSPLITNFNTSFNSSSNINANTNYALLLTSANTDTFRGLPANFALMAAYTLAGGTTYTLPVVSPDSIVVYKVGVDGAVSLFTDVAFDAANLYISTAGEAAAATYLVGTQNTQSNQLY